jgi:cytochrome c-type biogenesis protein CcmE
MRLAAALVVLALGCKSTDYSKPVSVDELIAAGDDRVDHEAVVTGFVKPGSIERKIVDQRSQTTFIITKAGKELHIRHIGPVPDIFSDEADVSVTGKLVRESGQLVVVSEGDGLTAKRHF